MGRYFEDFGDNQRFETPARTITEADIVAFAGLSGDYNPVHTDETSLAARDFGGRIAHGPMLVGMAFGLASRLDLVEGTVVALLGITWDFQAPVRPGDTIRAVIHVTERRPTKRPDRGVIALRFELMNQRGDVVQIGSSRMLVRRRS